MSDKKNDTQSLEESPQTTAETPAVGTDQSELIIELKKQNEELCQAYKALEATHSHYVELYDFAPVGYLTLSNEGVITEINLTAANLLGIERKKILNQRFVRFVNTDYKDIWYQHFLKTKQSCEKQSCELLFRHENGATFYLHLNCQCKSLVTTSSFIHIALTDVTERKKAELILRQNEALFATLVDYAPNGMFIVDGQLRLQQVNILALPVFESIQPVIGRDFAEVICHLWGVEIGNQIMAIFRHTLETGERYSSEYFSEIRHDIGIRQAYEWEVQRVVLPDGQYGLACYFNDITDRQHKERELRIAAVAFETQEAMMIADVNKVVLRVNKAFTRITGYSVEEATNLSFFDSKSSSSAFYDDIWNQVVHNGYWQGELTEKRKNGEMFLMAMNISSVTDDRGHISHYVGAFSDITERRRAEEKINELSRDFSAFLENTSDFIYYKDANNRFRFCSTALAKIVGCDKWRDMVGKHLFDLFPEETAKVYYEAELTVYRDGIPLLDNIEPYYDAEGNEGWVRTSKWPQFDQAGNVIGIFGISRDVTAQKVVEQALCWSEELNRKTLEAFPEHIAVINNQGVILSVNQAWIQFAQSNAATEISRLSVGANYLAACRQASADDANAKRALAGIEAILNGTLEQFALEYPCHSPQQKHWFFMTVVPLILDTIVTGAVISHQNITDRKLSELALRDSEMRYRHLLDNQTEIIYHFKIDGTILYINEAFCRLFGTTKEELVGYKWHPVAYPDDIPLINAKLNTLSPTNPIVTIENRIITAGDEIRWGQFVNRAFFDEDGNLMEMQSVGRDITERKLAEEALRIAAAAFEAQESIIVTDTNRVIQRVNQAFTRITGYSAEDAIGKTPGFLRSNLHDEEFYKTMFHVVSHDGYWQGELWDKRKNGELFPVFQTVTGVRDSEGQISHYVGTMVDITSQKQAEKILLDARERLENQVITSQEELQKNKLEMAEINTTLAVLLRYRETDKVGAQEALSEEMETTILPFLKKLKGASAGRRQTIQLLSILETNLKRLTDSYGREANLLAAYQKLTPIETQVASMIRQGMPTKTIATTLNIAPGTVSIHRKHIRKKLGLDSKASNLHSYLSSLAE